MARTRPPRSFNERNRTRSRQDPDRAPSPHSRYNDRDRYRDERPYSPPPARTSSRHNQHNGPNNWRPSDNRQRSRSPYQRSPPRGPSRGDFRDDRRNGDFRPVQPSDSWRPPQSDFTFRMDKPAGVAPFPAYDGYNARADNRRGGRRADGGGRSRGGGRGRRPWKPVHPSERALIAGGISSAHEERLGDNHGGAKFRNVDDLSDDEEHDMEISSRSSAESDFEKGPSKKRVRLEGAEEEEIKAAPKWSNPDPYTALPPPDEQQGKQKNVVAMIRKARIEESSKAANAPKQAEDFISFDTTDEEDDQESEHEVNGNSHGGDHEPPPPVPPAPPHARTGERQPQSTTLMHGLPAKPPTQDSGHVTHPPPPGTSSLPPLPPGPPPPLPPPPGVSLEPDRSGPLGSRKRTADDQIKPPDYGQAKKANKKAASGMLVPGWEPKPGEESCPWLTKDHSSTSSMAFRLHKEVVDFYEYVRPRHFEQRIRENLVQSLRKAMKRDARNFASADVYPFGSYMSGLYLPTADMDLVVCSADFINRRIPKFTTQKSWLFKFRTLLTAQRVADADKIEVISKARVPLVKYVDKATGLKVDVSFENLGGVDAIQTFLKWKQMYPAMPILVTVIKHFLLMRGLNEPVNGGIGGFSVICLVVSMLQLMPQVQSRNLIPEHHLGEMLLEFFDLYGHHFNYEVNAISLTPPAGYVRKNEVRGFTYKNSNRLSIIDPNNDSNDISGGSSNSYIIVRQFGEAFDSLVDQMKQTATNPSQGGGVLDVVMRGDYSSFRMQRDYLRHVHEKTLGPCSD